MTLSDTGDQLALQLASVSTDIKKVKRYVAPAPAECCFDGSAVALVWWPGVMVPENGGDWPCAGRVVGELNFRVDMCWPTMDDRGIVNEAQQAATAGCLMDILQAMAAKVELLTCDPVWRGLKLRDAVTQRPLGTCVSALLRVDVFVV